MGQEQKLGQQGDASSRQSLKRRRWMKLALIPGRLLVAVWALGGDLDHLDTSCTVVCFSILVAKLGDTDWVGGLQAGGKTGWTHVQRRVVKGSVSEWRSLAGMQGPALFSISMLTQWRCFASPWL